MYSMSLPKKNFFFASTVSLNDITYKAQNTYVLAPTHGIT
jgi:hypothetical protein